MENFYSFNGKIAGSFHFHKVIHVNCSPAIHKRRDKNKARRVDTPRFLGGFWGTPEVRIAQHPVDGLPTNFREVLSFSRGDRGNCGLAAQGSTSTYAKFSGCPQALSGTLLDISCGTVYGYLAQRFLLVRAPAHLTR